MATPRPGDESHLVSVSNPVGSSWDSLPLIMTAKQLSPLVDKSEDALANDRHFRRGIPFTRIEKRAYYLRDDVIAYLTANRIETRQ